MWCVDLFNSVYVQWNLCYNCKFTKFDTKLNVQIPVKSAHRNRNKNAVPVPAPEFRSIYGSNKEKQYTKNRNEGAQFMLINFLFAT